MKDVEANPEISPHYRRIVILGCAGTGKTTFARRLSQRICVPVICLDAMRRPGWTDADLEEFRISVADAHRCDAWVSDGNFAKATFDLRLPHADLIVWLEVPRVLCFWRAVIRVTRKGEAHRLRDITNVLRFTMKFDQINRPLIENQRLVHGSDVPILHLSSTAAARYFLLES